MTMFRRYRTSLGFNALLVGILLAAGAGTAWSQATSTATITGLVTDEQMPVVGAEVRMLESSTSAAQTTLTNEAGRYVIVNAAWNLMWSRSANRASRYSRSMPRRSTSVSTMQINATLKVGSTSTTVEVTASAGADL